MALLESVSPGDLAQAAQYNALVNAFVNVLGITDDAQTRQGRLTMPTVNATPTGVVSGQMWFRVDESKPYIRISGVNRPLGGIRQIKRVSQSSSLALTSGSPTDVPGATLSITTTGGRLLVGFMSPDTPAAMAWQVASASGGPYSAIGLGVHFYAFVDAINLGNCTFQDTIVMTAATMSFRIMNGPLPGMYWQHKPIAGTYTIKLQIALSGTNADSSGASSFLYGGDLVVLEVDD